MGMVNIALLLPPNMFALPWMALDEMTEAAHFMNCSTSLEMYIKWLSRTVHVEKECNNWIYIKTRTNHSSLHIDFPLICFFSIRPI